MDATIGGPKKRWRLAGWRWVALALALVACGPKAGGEASGAAAAEGASPPGGVCTHDGDCAAGLVCEYTTCEVAGPCGTRRLDAGGGEVERTTHRYDAQGRPLGSESWRGGERVRREETEWSADGRRATTRRWLHDPERAEPDVVVVQEYDARGAVVRVEERWPGDPEQGQVSEYRWPAPGACRVPEMTMRSRGGERGFSRARCEGGRAVGTELVRRREGREEVFRTRRYVWDANGRLAEMTNTFGAGIPVPPLRLVYRRNAAGLLTELAHDQGADGSVDQREVYDLSCWDLGPEGARYRPR